MSGINKLDIGDIITPTKTQIQLLIMAGRYDPKNNKINDLIDTGFVIYKILEVKPLKLEILKI